MNKKISAFEVTLSAAATAIATVGLSMGAINSYMLLLGYLVASCALMLPLSKNFLTGNLLAFAATTVLAFLFGGAAAPWRILPFILFFGLHPLANHLQIRFKLNTKIMLVAKAIWFDVTCYLMWRFLFNMTTNYEWVDNYIIPVILVGGSAFFVMYDRMSFNAQILINRFVKKIDKNR